jgi:hypothetical protein
METHPEILNPHDSEEVRSMKSRKEIRIALSLGLSRSPAAHGNLNGKTAAPIEVASGLTPLGRGRPNCNFGKMDPDFAANNSRATPDFPPFYAVATLNPVQPSPPVGSGMPIRLLDPSLL